MCRECHQNPCHPSCENSEPQVVFNCSQCGEEILDGETYFGVLGNSYILCETCARKHYYTAEYEEGET